MMSVTSDLGGFGHRELELAQKLIGALINPGAPEDFELDDVRLAFNSNTGNVFLVNADRDVLMLRDGWLEKFVRCIDCHNEGFVSDMQWNEKLRLCGSCIAWRKSRRSRLAGTSAYALTVDEFLQEDDGV